MDQALPQSLCESHTWKYYSLQDFFVEDILYLYLYKDIPYLRFVKCTVHDSNALQLASRVPMNSNSRKGLLQKLWNIKSNIDTLLPVNEETDILWNRYNHDK